MASKEPLYQLDLVIDTKKPQWSWLQEMATLYRSAIIYSNGKYKIISERDDLPVRQVFHSGNIVREKTEIRIGSDPLQINQVSAQFSNKQLDYERDVWILNDSQSVLIDGDPIKPTDFDLTGLTRKSEVVRRASIEMQVKRSRLQEMTFTTGLEGIVVEPGDRCIAGILMTDWENGFGGRAVDGSTTSIIVDKAIELNSGYNYDLWVWHTAADTPELRTIVGGTVVIGITPTTPFDYAVIPGDRWAAGVQSEDLVDLIVKRVVHNQNGTTTITGNKFHQIGFLLDCPDSAGSFDDYFNMPTNPWSITTVQSDCAVCFQMKYTAPSCVGGALLKGMPNTPYINNCFRIVFPDTTNLPGLPNSWNAFYNRYGLTAENTITFISGPNSGVSRRIIAYPYYLNSFQAAFPNEYMMLLSPLPNRSTSGDQYYITFDQGSNFGGFTGRWWVNTGDRFSVASYFSLPTINGNSGCFDLSGTADQVFISVSPVSSAGAFIDNNHETVFRFDIPGCFAQDDRILSSVASITTQSVSTLFGLYLPSSLMGPDQGLEVKVLGLMNDVCASAETTKASFALTYAGSTVCDSLVINVRNAADIISVGSNAPFELKAELKVYAVPITHVRITFGYQGYQSGGTFVTTQMVSGMINSVNFTQVQCLTFTALMYHTDTLGAVHSHGCHAIALDHGEFRLLDSMVG